MSVYLDVPFVSQLNYGGGMNDWTGCWYCSACMIAYHFEAGPRLGVPEIHSGTLSNAQRNVLKKFLGGKDNFWEGHAATGSERATKSLEMHGINGKDEHDLLAEREALEAVPNCEDATFNYDLHTLELMLRTKGPIFFYWTKDHGGFTYGHASVIIGTDDAANRVYYHDPENAPNSSMPLTEFNNRRQRWDLAMMRRSNVLSNSVTLKAG